MNYIKEIIKENDLEKIRKEESKIRNIVNKYNEELQQNLTPDNRKKQIEKVINEEQEKSELLKEAIYRNLI